MPILSEGDLLALLGESLDGRGRAREHLREAVLRLLGAQRVHRAAVLEDREDVAVADEARERRGVVRRARLRADEAAGRAPCACGARACPSRRRSAGRGMRYGRRSLSCHIVRRSVARPRGVQRSRSERPEPSTIRTPVERHARRARAVAARPRARPPPSRRRPARRRPPSAASPRRSCRCRRPCGGRERRAAADSTSASGAAWAAATPTAAPPCTPTPAWRRSRRKSCAAIERGPRRLVPSRPAAVDDERRERRRLVEVELGLPAESGAARVEPALVAEDPAAHVPDPVAPPPGARAS